MTVLVSFCLIRNVSNLTSDLRGQHPVMMKFHQQTKWQTSVQNIILKEPLKTVFQMNGKRSKGKKTRALPIDDSTPFFHPGTKEWTRSTFVRQSDFLYVCYIDSAHHQRRPDACDRCIKLDLQCVGHKGFAPCVPCKQGRNACSTNGKTAIQYHNELIEDGTISYEDTDEFKPTRRLKLSVRTEYAAKQRRSKASSKRKPNKIYINSWI